MSDRIFGFSTTPFILATVVFMVLLNIGGTGDKVRQVLGMQGNATNIGAQDVTLGDGDTVIYVNGVEKFSPSPGDTITVNPGDKVTLEYKGTPTQSQPVVQESPPVQTDPAVMKFTFIVLVVLSVGGLLVYWIILEMKRKKRARQILGDVKKGLQSSVALKKAKVKELKKRSRMSRDEFLERHRWVAIKKPRAPFERRRR